jgi:S1-C subfamily serine protease
MLEELLDDSKSLFRFVRYHGGSVRLLRSTPVRRLVLVAVVAAMAIAVAGVPLAGGAAASSATGVVVIQTRLGYANATAAATGMVLTSSGEVLTNNHVIRGATRIRVQVPETGRTYGARVLGYSVSADVALLKLGGASGLETVSVGNSSTVELGDDVTAVGNAGGTGTLTTKQGAITGLGRTITVDEGQGDSTRLTRLIETDAGLRQGDSGGPLLDSAGRVVGMNAAASLDARVRSGESDGYAIPINRATSIVRQIESGGSSDSVHIGATPFLGISVATSTSFGNTASGVLVGGVRAGSPAARAGVGAGDVIVSLNGNPVRTYARLVARLLRWHPGDKVRLAWVDELGSGDAASVKLASGPPQ